MDRPFPFLPCKFPRGLSIGYHILPYSSTRKAEFEFFQKIAQIFLQQNRCFHIIFCHRFFDLCSYLFSASFCAALCSLSAAECLSAPRSQTDTACRPAPHPAAE